MHTLSHVGRLTLTRHVLLTLPIYCMGAQSLPKTIINRLTSKVRKFSGEKSQQNHYWAYVAWDRICMPKEEEGLDLKSLEILNEAVLLKAF
jgi:hypothetical protein